MADAPNLKIDPERLWDTLMDTARFGANARGGICRLTLSDEDRAVRDWFAARCRAIGCSITVDDCGNMFARRPGRRADLPPICIGSHLDTQPTGGKFDGVLGVLGALEVLRTLADLGYETQAPIEIVNWTNEEGSRFSPCMLGSGVFAGAFTRDYAHDLTDSAGKRFGDELARIGYRGSPATGDHAIGAMFELHIEQGPILEAEKKMIGIVNGVQGMRWFDVTFTGQTAHTGATPMRLRRDALLGAARLVEKVNEIAAAHAPDAVATVGSMQVSPNSRNVVAGTVFLTVDLRHPDDAVLDRMEAAYRAAVDAIAAGLGLEVTQSCLWTNPAVRFDPGLNDHVRKAAARSGHATREMVSGAGHDAAYIARVAPTTMIFVPCAGGISHNEAEWTSKEECAAGVQVLLDAVLSYDATLT
jgi:N-carbamoyl-L-amino-acid hydrolase